jgi:hypothetical protein
MRRRYTFSRELRHTMQDCGWTYLSEEFIEDLERAIGGGGTIVSVLKQYGINRGTYYSWLAIGDGRMGHWRDGTPVSVDMRTNCRRLFRRVLRVREAHLRSKRQALS